MSKVYHQLSFYIGVMLLVSLVINIEEIDLKLVVFHAIMILISLLAATEQTISANIKELNDSINRGKENV